MIKIYVELVALDNLAMNYIILFLTARFSARPMKIYRGILSAALGAIYGVVYILPAFSFLRPIGCKFLLSLAMIAIAFGVGKKAVRPLAVFYGITFILGGAMFGLLYFTGAGTMAGGGLMLLNGYPLRIFLLAGFITVLGLQFYWKWASRRLSNATQVRLTMEGECLLEGIIDTGHGLKDPSSGYPVLIADFESVKQILPQEVVQALEKGSGPGDALAAAEGTPWETEVRLIPYYAMGQNGLLFALRPKKLMIYRGTWKEIKKVYVAVSKGSIRQESGFSVLLPAALARY